MSLRVPIPGLVEGESVLSAEVSHYVCRVRRLALGGRFVAFDPVARKEADATVVEPSGSAARVVAGPLREPRVTATSPLVLIYALAKGDKVDAVVRDATELGATRVVLTRTERTVVKVAADRAHDKLERYRRIAEQAARQCGRADPPEIEGVFDWAEALESAGDCAARFCLAADAEAALGSELAAAMAKDAGIAFAIGPEGGLSPKEIDLARDRGFQPCALGPFILRTETVAAAVLGACRVLSTVTSPEACS